MRRVLTVKDIVNRCHNIWEYNKPWLPELVSYDFFIECCKRILMDRPYTRPSSIISLCIEDRYF